MEDDGIVDPFLAPLENDEGVEQSGANYCATYALEHIANLCSAADPAEMVFTGSAEEDHWIYKRFRASFPFLDVSTISWDDLNNEFSRLQWRSVLTAMEGTLYLFNIITLLRTDSRGGYGTRAGVGFQGSDFDGDHLLVPRGQFVMIELARNKEGHNHNLRAQRTASLAVHLAEMVVQPEFAAEAVEAIATQLPKLLPIAVLKQTCIGKALSRGAALVPPQSASARTAASVLQLWQLGVKQEKASSSSTADAHELMLQAIRLSTQSGVPEAKAAAVVVKHAPLPIAPILPIVTTSGEQSHPGVEVKHSEEGYGNILVTTQDFKKDSIVLAETPLLTFDPTDLDDFICKFNQATAEVQERVLDMGHRSDEQLEADVGGDGQYGRSRKKETELAQKYSLPVEQVAILLDIRHTNAYSFDDQASLFWCAAKANHSCSPNVAYSSQSGTNMEYIALCDIPAGTEVTPSYIMDLYSTPRAARRTKLLDTKNFECQCERCKEFDDCRLVKCPIKTCTNGMIYQHRDHVWQGWTCSVCERTTSVADMEATETFAQEEALRLRYTAVENQMRAGSVGDPTELRNIITEGATKLSSTHFIVANTHRLLYHFCSGQVDRMTTGGFEPTAECMSPWGEVISIQTFCKEAAAATLQVVRARECVAVGCVVRRCSGDHEAVHDTCIDALQGVKMLARLKDPDSIQQAACVYSKYKSIFDRAVGLDKVKVLGVKSWS